MNRTTITALACTAALGAGMLLADPSEAAAAPNSDLHIVFVSHCQADSSGFYNSMRAFRNEARADRVFNRLVHRGQDNPGVLRDVQLVHLDGQVKGSVLVWFRPC